MSEQCVSYMRCSGDGQILGDTWERQREVILKFASANSHDLISEFRDEGVTGKMELENRAGLSACMQLIQANNIQLVLVESSDRLARDMIVAEVIVREFQKIGVRVVAASGGIDLTAGDDLNPTAKLIRQILAAIAEFDRCVTVLKLRGARERLRTKNGKCEGRISFGKKPSEAQTLEQMIAWRATGATCQKIADDLNTCRYKSRSGKKWHRSSVAKILSRFELAAPTIAKDIGAAFREQAEKWENETGHLSSPNQKMLHPSYQAILGMGQEHREEIIDLLLQDLKDNRRPWFWALSYLAQANPITPAEAGRMDLMIDAWMRWGKTRKHA